MNGSRTSAVLTTCCVGMAVGAAAYMMAGTSNKKVKRIKRNTGKALRQMSGFIDNVSYMMR